MGRKTTYGGRPAHPAAEVFPMHDEARIKELAEDIRENGLLEPVVENREGRILDGRARLLACDLAGVPVFWHTYTGDDPWAFTLTKNYETRNAPPYVEMAFIGAHVKPRGTGPIPPDPHRLTTPDRPRLAELLHTSRHSIDRARKVVVNGVDGLEECCVKYGVPINTAARIADMPDKAQHAFVSKVLGGMSWMRAAGLRNTDKPEKRIPKKPRNQHTNSIRFRYIHREAIAGVRDSLAVVRHLLANDGLSPDIEPAEAVQWLNDLGRERRNLNKLMNLLKERTQ